MTSSATATLARVLLVVICSAFAVIAIGPFQWLEFALVPWDKAAHFMAFYLVTAMLFLAFPRRRRLDLALMATLAGAALEMMQLATGRDAEVGDMIANGAGAFAVVIPGYLEIARMGMRGRKQVERRRDAFARAKEASPAQTPQAELV
jgi:VanZ family protein